jgi:hypothetical protein
LPAGILDEPIEVFHGRRGDAFEDDDIIVSDDDERVTGFKTKPFSDVFWYDDLTL